MDITLTGAVGWVFAICVGGLAIVIIVLGTVYLANLTVFWLVDKLAQQFRFYKRLVAFMYAYERLRARKRGTLPSRIPRLPFFVGEAALYDGCLVTIESFDEKQVTVRTQQGNPIITKPEFLRHVPRTA